MSVKIGDEASVVPILVDELQVLVGYFNLVLRNLRRQLRWKYYLLLSPHCLC